MSKMDGNPLPDSATYSIQGDGISQPGLKLDLNGQGDFQFTIPGHSTDNFFPVTYTVQADALTNTKADSIALVQKSKMFIDFTPESGMAVFGANNKIYFEAFVNAERSEFADFQNAFLTETSGST